MWVYNIIALSNVKEKLISIIYFIIKRFFFYIPIVDFDFKYFVLCQRFVHCMYYYGLN